MMFLPLFLQAVVGVSAAKSGGAITPMMFAMIFSSVMAGQAMQKLGRYKFIAVLGVSVTTVAAILFATMDVNTTYGTVIAFMVVMGAGLGMTMPVFNLAIQNAVDIRQVGVATSSLQFVRALGGSLGGAIFGAVLTNRFGAALTSAVSPEVQATLPPGMMDKLSNPQTLMNPQFQAQMKAGGPELMQKIAPIMAGVKQALASSLHDVFLGAAILVGLGIVFALLLKDAPLRTSNRMPAPTAE
jgi:MFS family permease